MRLLVITDYYRDEARNGSEVFCGALIDLLREVHNVDVIARESKGDSVRSPRFAIDDVIANDHTALQEHLSKNVKLADYDLIYNLGALIFGCNVVHVLLSADDSVPLVNHFQAMLGPYAREEGLHDHLQQMNAAGQHDAAARAAMNIFLSQDELMMANSSGYPLHRSVTAVVPNGLPFEETAGVQADDWFLPEERRGENRPIVIAAAGRFADFTKGADLVYRAFAELRQDRDDVFLVSVGNSRRFAYLLDDTPRDSWHLAEWLPRTKFLATIAAADLLVMPSRYEPFGLIAIEAQMLGVPVLANAVGGLAEIVHHNVGGMLSLRQDGSLGLYLAMKTMLADRVRLREMGETGRELARREYGIERIGALIDKQLRRALVVRQPAEAIA